MVLPNMIRCLVSLFFFLYYYVMKKDIADKVSYYADTLRDRLGSNLLQIILFGSRAREDYHEGSDYDFVVVVSNKNENVRNLVLETGVDFLNKYDELTAELLFNQQEWENQRKFPLGINIEREGIFV